MRSSELSDAQWGRLRPLLRPQKPRTGRPARDHRTVINGILWVLRTGSPWRALPERYGSWKTVSSRFYRWQRAGIWDRLLAAVQWEADAEGRLDWSLHFVDGTVVRARFRRLAKDYERLPETVAGLHFVAFACLMLHRLITVAAQSP